MIWGGCTTPIFGSTPSCTKHQSQLFAKVIFISSIHGVFYAKSLVFVPPVRGTAPRALKKMDPNGSFHPTPSPPKKNTLPETNSLPLKIGLPNRKLVFQPSIFRCYVSFRECNMKEQTNKIFPALMGNFLHIQSRNNTFPGGI